jgi:hypothetical protein
MNKERAINILLEYAIESAEKIKLRQEVGFTEKVSDDLTAAILFLQQDRDKNKVDAKVEIKGVQFNIRKGV